MVPQYFLRTVFYGLTALTLAAFPSCQNEGYKIKKISPAPKTAEKNNPQNTKESFPQNKNSEDLEQILNRERIPEKEAEKTGTKKETVKKDQRIINSEYSLNTPPKEVPAPPPPPGKLYFNGSDYFQGGAFSLISRPHKKISIELNKIYPLPRGNYRVILKAQTENKKTCTPPPFYLRGKVKEKCKTETRIIAPKRTCTFRIKSGLRTKINISKNYCKVEHE